MSEVVTIPLDESRDRRDAVPLKVWPSGRFTISIDYKAYLAFYSIGIYKGGWTGYFLAPALDCRESRTHLLCTRVQILATSHRLYCVLLNRTLEPRLDRELVFRFRHVFQSSSLP